MFRVLILILVSLSFGAVTHACDMDAETRAVSLSDYYENGLSCLQTPPEPLRFDPVMEQLFLNRINTERRARGLSDLRLRKALLPAARFHSLDMASNAFFAHRGPDGRDTGERIAVFDRTLLAKSTAENVAQFGPAICTDEFGKEVACFTAPGFELPTPGFVVDDLHQKLMDSEGHRANILAEGSTHVAIGVAREDTAFYVTQLFVNEMGELAAPLPICSRATGKLKAKAKIEGFDSTTFAAMNSEEDRVELAGRRLRSLAPGQQFLIARGQNITEKRVANRTVVTTEWLDLFGPAFEILPPKES